MVVLVLERSTSRRRPVPDDRKVGPWLYCDETGSPMKFQDWEVQYAHWDWAYDDYTGMPRGENWPAPPPDAEPPPRRRARIARSGVLYTNAERQFWRIASWSAKRANRSTHGFASRTRLDRARRSGWRLREQRCVDA